MLNYQVNENEITGVRVSLYPMTNNFSEQILAGIKKIDTSTVWSQTDLFSTLYRGEQVSVVDAAAATFISAYDSKVHMVGEFTFSKGCPGDSSGDSHLTGLHLTPNETLINSKGDFPINCKYSFYTFGKEEYMEEISEIVKIADDMGLNPKSAHYCTLLSGTASQLFAYFDKALTYANEHLNHFVIEATVSVNSPSLKGGESHV